MSDRQMQISKDEYLEGVMKYWYAVTKLPIELQEKCPNFDKFLSPANYSNFSQEWIELSITGTNRYKMLDSPHAVTLLGIYAAQRFDNNK